MAARRLPPAASGSFRERVCRAAPSVRRSLASGLGQAAGRLGRALMVLPVLEALGIGLLVVLLGH